MSVLLSFVLEFVCAIEGHTAFAKIHFAYEYSEYRRNASDLS